VCQHGGYRSGGDLTLRRLRVCGYRLGGQHRVYRHGGDLTRVRILVGVASCVDWEWATGCVLRMGGQTGCTGGQIRMRTQATSMRLARMRDLLNRSSAGALAQDLYQQAGFAIVGHVRGFTPCCQEVLFARTRCVRELRRRSSHRQGRAWEEPGKRPKS